jgi:hypothetical protein
MKMGMTSVENTTRKFYLSENLYLKFNDHVQLIRGFKRVDFTLDMWTMLRNNKCVDCTLSSHVDVKFIRLNKCYVSFHSIYKQGDHIYDTYVNLSDLEWVNMLYVLDYET